jgi:two-component system cell cycle sensor histidine kinase/response regulator CckA
MLTSVIVAGLGAVTALAIVAAGAAIWRARSARRAGDQQLRARGAALDADSRLIDDVAHDLNDLLTAITGHAELLIASLDPSGAGMRDAHAIRRAALSAARLTKPLHTLSSGSRAPTDVIDVNAVTARTVASLQPMLGPAIDVTLRLDHGIKRIKVGASHLDEIVLSLCMRARDAMPNGGHLTIATTMHTHDGRDPATGARGEYVRVVVTDTGCELSAAAQSRLFERSPTGDAARGNAVGLANVNAIVTHAGGRIRVHSAAGVGTTLTIDMPATSEPAAAIERAPAAAPVLVVLVVDDEPGMREFMRLVLVRAGHDVVAVADSRAALAALSRRPAIALMIVDVVLPDMDGYEVVAEARKIAPDICVVFTSAFAVDPARQPSGDGFLAKPFTSGSLTGIVEQALLRTAPA